MTRSFSKPSFTQAIAVLTLASLSMFGCANSNTLDNLQGTWSTDCQNASSAYVKDSVAFSGSGLTETLSSFSDSACSTIGSTITATFGSVSVGNSIPSSNYNQISVSVSSIQLTPKTTTAASNYNSSSYCGFTNWTSGTAKDITGITSCGMKAAGTLAYEGFSVSQGTLKFVNTLLSSAFDFYDNLSGSALTSAYLVSPVYRKQ